MNRIGKKRENEKSRIDRKTFSQIYERNSSIKTYRNKQLLQLWLVTRIFQSTTFQFFFQFSNFQTADEPSADHQFIGQLFDIHTSDKE